MAANRSRNIPKIELGVAAQQLFRKFKSLLKREEGQREYEKWKAEQAALKAQTADITA